MLDFLLASNYYLFMMCSVRKGFINLVEVDCDVHSDSALDGFRPT